MNTICFSSGDQRGKQACVGGNVSWSRSLPSALLRHKTTFGILVVSHPLPVLGEVHILCRYSGKIGLELLGFLIETSKFPTGLRTECK